MSRLSSWDTEIKLPAVQFDKKQEGRIKNEEVPQENEKEKGMVGDRTKHVAKNTHFQHVSYVGIEA